MALREDLVKQLVLVLELILYNVGQLVSHGLVILNDLIDEERLRSDLQAMLLGGAAVTQLLSYFRRHGFASNDDLILHFLCFLVVFFINDQAVLLVEIILDLFPTVLSQFLVEVAIYHPFVRFADDHQFIDLADLLLALFLVIGKRFILSATATEQL